jgi:hypothetical protein
MIGCVLTTCDYDGGLIEYEDSAEAAGEANDALRAGREPVEVAKDWADRVMAVSRTVDADLGDAAPSLRGKRQRLSEIRGRKISSDVLVKCLTESLRRHGYSAIEPDRV